jgi:hypothetical protein
MKTNHILLFATLLLTGLASCENEEKNPFLQINPFETVQVENNGGDAFIEVNTNVDEWTLNIDDVTWLTGQVTAGGIRVTAEANPNNATRRALVRIVSEKYPVVNKTLSIIQGNTYLNILPELIPELSGYGDITNIGINTNAEDWTASADSAWLIVTKTPDGIAISVEENPGKVLRTAHLTIRSEKYGIEQVLSVTQGITFIPRLEFSLSSDQPVSKTGGSITVTVDTNIDDWDFNIENSPEWLDVLRTDNTLALTVSANPLKERNATLNFTSAAYPDMNKQTQLTQLGITVIFEDDFSFLSGSLSDDIFTSTSEKRFDDWVTAYGTTNGWTSTPAPDASTNPNPWVYSRNGYVKFSKTSYNGDLISPKLSEISGTQDVVVSFKACGYTSAGSATSAGTLDPIKYTNGASGGHADVPNELNIEIIGAGTASQTQFILDNYPDDNRRVHGDGWLWQMDPGATRTFIITGATADTQIRFIAGKKVGISTDDGTTNGTYYTYRHGLDDVLVYLKED